MFQVKVDKNQAQLTMQEPMTTGSQNVYVIRFEFSEEWANLTKIAVFRSGTTIVNVPLNAEDQCMIPWEVLTKTSSIDIGVYGTISGAVILPTTWARTESIREGVVMGTKPTNPSGDTYQQLLDRLTAVEDMLENGDFGQGVRGPRGYSAYELAAQNGYQGTEEEWLASLKGERGDPFLIKKVYPDLNALITNTDPIEEGMLVGISMETGGEEGGHLFIKTATGYEFFFNLAEVDGIKGEDGAPGADGAPGKSAYEIALENGFEGSEEEWLASLVGPEGPPGEGSVVEGDGVRGMTKAEYDALPDEDKKGLVVVTDEEVPAGGGDSAQNDTYSTEETVIGTWIDGKPIYRVAAYHTRTSGSGNSFTMSNLSDDVETVTDLRAIVGPDGVTGFYPGYKYDLSLNVKGKRVSVTIPTSGNSGGNPISLAIVVEYTKTTD